MIASLMALLVSRGLGTINLQMPEYLIAIVLIGSSIMIFLETSFTKDMEWVDSTSINFLVGFPSSIIAFLLGAGYLIGDAFVVETFGGFEGGIYLTALIILVYQGVSAILDFEPSIDDFRKN